jgi:hypothetical protein
MLARDVKAKKKRKRSGRKIKATCEVRKLAVSVFERNFVEGSSNQ